jgi:NADPH2:quinone reductase
MRAVVIEAYGGPEQMKLVERPDPVPGPGEVRVRVRAAGVNFIDVYKRTGLYKGALPLVAGEEGAGVVDALGPGASYLRVGERVAWAGVAGSYATHAIAKESALVPVPDGVDDVNAAAVMLQGMTAHYLARSTWPLREGEHCVVHAAAGGVGLLLCQMAKRAGAIAIGTASTEEKRRLALDAGAAHVVDYAPKDGADFAEEARRITGGRGVDVVYDSVGKDTFARSLASLRPRGMLVVFGQSSGPIPPFDVHALRLGGSLFLTRPTLHDYTRTRSELLERAGDVLGAVARGDLAVRVHAVLPLERAAEAHRLLESRATSGKLVLRVS